MRFWLSLIITLSLLFTSCNRCKEHVSFDLSHLLESRLNQPFSCPCEDVESFLKDLEGKELSINEAMKITLLNNPKLQEKFAEIGIARADLIEAGLLENPVFESSLLFTSDAGFFNKSGLSFAFGLLDVFLVPLRQNVARAELEKVKLEVGQFILDTAFEVQGTFISLQGLVQKKQYWQQICQFALAAKELASAQLKAGSINQYTFEKHSNAYLNTLLKVHAIDLEILSAQEQLNRLMGLPYDCAWKVKTELPLPFKREFSEIDLEQLALENRLDIGAARWNIERIVRAGALKKWWAYSDLRLGVQTEREIEGPQVTGPVMGGAIPLFNYGQADRVRLASMLQQNCYKLKTLEVQTASEVREAFKTRARLKEILFEYENERLPLLNSSAASSESLYNVMGVDAFELFDSKINLLSAKIDYTEALVNFWRAEIALQRAIGGVLK